MRIIVTQTKIWEVELQHNDFLPQDVIDDIVENAMQDDPDYEGTEVEHR